jgi:adenine-specific DNA-methyltransferase
LGEEFIRLRSAETRRTLGAVYTPPQIVEAMVEWAASVSGPPPARIVDPGSGSGRFLILAAKAFPEAHLVAAEIDPLAVKILRANANAAGFADRLTVHQGDYRTLDLGRIEGRTLFIGNPPYVRHHRIAPEAKDWLAATARSLGLRASKLAGLHIHFFLRTRELAHAGDFGSFITASEWLDVNYGSVLRQLLAGSLGGTALHMLDPQANPFGETMTTGTIACFRVGERPSALSVRAVKSLSDLKPLSAGKSIAWTTVAATERWSGLLRPMRLHANGTVELGELFRVHRGQVTGCNAVWIAGPEARRLPLRFLFPAITRAADLFAAGETIASANHLCRVIDLPSNLDNLTDSERENVDAFLEWAKRYGAHEAYVARNRATWWSVGLRKPAPILCTYMARRPPAFVRNIAAVHNINISHGLYPREPADEIFLAQVVRYLRKNVSTSGGRTYAGGLVKYEPGEVARLRIPIAFEPLEREAA